MIKTRERSPSGTYNLTMKLIEYQLIMIFVMTWGETKVNVTEKWSSHWIKYLMEKCQNGDKPRDF